MPLFPITIILTLIIVILLFKLFRKNNQREPELPHHVSADDLIWKSILQLTNPDALHSNWHISFNQVKADICTTLEADELFLLDNSPDIGSPLFPSPNDSVDTYAHNWILSVPTWMDRLEQGKNIHDLSANLDIEEQAILDRKSVV